MLLDASCFPCLLFPRSVRSCVFLSHRFSRFPPGRLRRVPGRVPQQQQQQPTTPLFAGWRWSMDRRRRCALWGYWAAVGMELIIFEAYAATATMPSVAAGHNCHGSGDCCCCSRSIVRFADWCVLASVIIASGGGRGWRNSVFGTTNLFPLLPFSSYPLLPLSSYSHRKIIIQYIPRLLLILYGCMADRNRLGRWRRQCRCLFRCNCLRQLPPSPQPQQPPQPPFPPMPVSVSDEKMTFRMWDVILYLQLNHSGAILSFPISLFIFMFQTEARVLHKILLEFSTSCDGSRLFDRSTLLQRICLF